MVDEPLPPLPKPKYGLLKPQPLNYQQDTLPIATDPTDQKAMSHPASLPTDNQSGNTVHPVQPIDPHAVVLGKDVETDAATPEHDEMNEPDEFYEAEEEQLNAVMLGTGINQATNRRETVTIGDVERRSGLYMLGKPGMGKTTLLVNMILQDVDNGHGLCFIDPHGDAIEEVLKRLPDWRKEDVILLDPLDKTYPFGLNIFQCNDPTDEQQVSRTLNNVIGVFAKLFTKSGDIEEAPLMHETLLNTTILLIYNQHYTLAEVPLLLTNQDATAKLIPSIGSSQDDVRQWWLDYNRQKFVERVQVTGSTRRRLQTFLTDEMLRYIVGQSQTTINFREVMDQGKILLVKLPRKQPELTTLVGSLIIGQLLTAVYSRDDTPEADRRHFCLYCDEFQNFATPDFAKLITEGRKYRIATTIAHQERYSQFGKEDKNIGATLAAPNMVLFQTTVKDAEELAPEYARPPEAAWEEEIEPIRFERVEEQIADEVEEDIAEISQNPVEYLQSARGTHGNARVREASSTFLNLFATLKYPSEYEGELNRLLVDVMERRVETGTVQLAERIELLLYEFFYHIRTPPKSDRCGYPINNWLNKNINYLSENYFWAQNMSKTLRVSSDEVNEQDVERLLCKDNFDNLFYDEINPERWGYPLLVSEKLHRLAELYEAVQRSVTHLILEMVTKSSSLSMAEKQMHDNLNDYFLELARLHCFNQMEKEVRGRHNDNIMVSPYRDMDTWNALGRYRNEKDFKQRLEKFSQNEKSEGIKKLISQYKEEWKVVEEGVQAYVPVAINDVVSFARTLLVLCEGLAADPIMVPTGKKRLVPKMRTHLTYHTIPAKTISHPQRTEADMVGEMRRELMSLPRFTAYCKTVEEVGGRQIVSKYKLSPKKLEAEDDEIVVQNRKQDIRTHTIQSGYVTERTKVKQAIADRRAELLKREPPKPRTTLDEDED